MATKTINTEIFETPNYETLEAIFANSHAEIPENHSPENYLEITYWFRAHCKHHPNKTINTQSCQIPPRGYFIHPSIIPEAITPALTEVVRYVNKPAIELAGRSIDRLINEDLPKSEVRLDIPLGKCCYKAEVFMKIEAREL